MMMNGYVKLVKRAIFALVTLLCACIFGCSTLTRIDAGHIGVEVELAGQGMQLETGWVFHNPLTKQLIEFPVSVQSVDESIAFSSIEGVDANADVGISFHIDPAKAAPLYARFRQNDLRELAYGYMRNVLRASFNEVASQMPIREIYGAGKSRMVAQVTATCAASLGKDGIIVDQLTIHGALRLPQNVADRINEATGVAEATRQKATGEADALVIRTKAEVQTRLVEAISQAEANTIINATLTPQLIQFKYADSWDGKFSTSGSANPALNVGK